MTSSTTRGTGSSTSERRTYAYVTDHQFSVIAVLEQRSWTDKHGVPTVYGAVQERVHYDPYGYAEHRRPGDTNNDGELGDGTEAADFSYALLLWSIEGGAYDARYDLNRDGVIDAGDQDGFGGGYVTAAAPLASGAISDHGPGGPGNIVGYAGYLYDEDLGLYLSRHRYYSPTRGRWVTRDAASRIQRRVLMHAVQRTDSMFRIAARSRFIHLYARVMHMMIATRHVVTRRDSVIICLEKR
jgi:RHS repeat-associated protein